MVGAVIDMRTRKHLIQFPTFQMLAGDYDFPLWFVRAGMEQLQANEPYTLCSGLGLVLRYWHLVTSHVNPEVDMARFEMHVLEYPKRFPKMYMRDVAAAFEYELNDICLGLDTLPNLATRERGGHHRLLRDLKHRRDNAESVSRLLKLLNVTSEDTAYVDDTAQSIRPYLVDDHRYLTVIEPRLNTLYDHFPQYWWGVKGTL